MKVDPYAVEELRNEMSDTSSIYRIRKSHGIIGELDKDRKRVAEVYQILLFFITDRAMRENRILLNVSIRTEEFYIYLDARFGSIQGMDVKTPGGH